VNSNTFFHNIKPQKKGIAKRLLLKIIGKGNYDSYDIDLKLIVQLNRNVCILANDFALFSVIVTW